MDSYQNPLGYSHGSSTIPSLYDAGSAQNASNFSVPVNTGYGRSGQHDSRATVSSSLAGFMSGSRKEISTSQLEDAAFAARVLGVSENLQSNLMTRNDRSTGSGGSYGMHQNADTDQQQIRSVVRDVPSASNKNRRWMNKARNSQPSVDHLETQVRAQAEAQARAQTQTTQLQLQTQAQLQATQKRLKELEESQAKKDRKMMEMEQALRKRKMDAEMNFMAMKQPRMDPMPPHQNLSRGGYFESGDPFRMSGRDPFAQPYDPYERSRFSLDRNRFGQGSGIRPLLPGLRGMPPSAQRKNRNRQRGKGKQQQQQQKGNQQQKGKQQQQQQQKGKQQQQKGKQQQQKGKQQQQQQQKGKQQQQQQKGKQQQGKQQQQQQKGKQQDQEYTNETPFPHDLKKRHGLNKLKESYAKEMELIVQHLLSFDKMEPLPEELKDAVWCYKCGKEGHRQKDCQEPNIDEKFKEYNPDVSGNTVIHQVKLLNKMKFNIHIHDKKLYNLMCYFCDVKCKSMEDYYIHLERRVHQRNIQKLEVKVYGNPGRIDLANRLINLPSVFSKDEGDKAQNKDENYIFMCHVCLMTVPGPIEKHQETGKHQVRLASGNRCVTCSMHLFMKEKEVHENTAVHKEMLKARGQGSETTKPEKIEQAKRENGFPVGAIVGRSFVHPAQGVFCRSCRKFCSNVTTEEHCKQEEHHKKLWKWCHVVKQMPPSEILEMHLEAQPSTDMKAGVEEPMESSDQNKDPSDTAEEKEGTQDGEGDVDNKGDQEEFKGGDDGGNGEAEDGDGGVDIEGDEEFKGNDDGGIGDTENGEGDVDTKGDDKEEFKADDDDDGGYIL